MSQMKKMEVKATGIETANQPSHEMGGSIYSIATAKESSVSKMVK